MPNYEKMLEDFVKERNEAVITYDVETFKKFYAKWKKLGVYEVPLPIDQVLEISMRKMVYATPSFTQEQRDEAKKWLVERGYEVLIDDN